MHLKKIHITFLCLIFLTNSYEQISVSPATINNKRNKVLTKKNNNQIVFYSIIEDKVINKYTFPNSTFDIHYEFSKNDNQFFIIYKFIDSNFQHKNWKPQKYYKEFTDFDGESGWKIEKSVIQSKLNVYDSKNGSLLYSVNDTGFFYEDLSIRSMGRLKGKIKLPKYFENANYVVNSDSLIYTISVIPSYTSPTHYGHRIVNYDIWDLSIRKKIISNFSEEDTTYKRSFKVSDYRVEISTIDTTSNSKNFIKDSKKNYEKLSWISNDNKLQSKFINDSTFEIINLQTKEVVFKKVFGVLSYSHFYNCTFTDDNKKFLFLNEEGTELNLIYDIEKSKLIYTKDLE